VLASSLSKTVTQTELFTAVVVTQQRIISEPINRYSSYSGARLDQSPITVGERFTIGAITPEPLLAKIPELCSTRKIDWLGLRLELCKHLFTIAACAEEITDVEPLLLRRGCRLRELVRGA